MKFTLLICVTQFVACALATISSPDKNNYCRSENPEDCDEDLIVLQDFKTNNCDHPDGGESTLERAARLGVAVAVDELLKLGADPFHETKRGNTALHLAARCGHVKVLYALRPYIPWETASNKTGMTALHVAASYGQEAVVREILKKVPVAILSKRPADDPEADYGCTALHMAARTARADVAKLLLEDPDMQVDARTTIKEKTPLLMASAYNQFDAARVLVDGGADVNAQDSYGRTPLHYAVMDMPKSFPIESCS